MASQAYNAWATAVRVAGGRVVAVPGSNGRPRYPSAAYPYTVWGAKANAGAWPLPNEYSNNGQTGYYHAPAQLQAEIKTFGQATDKEIAKGATELMDKWNIPAPLRGLRAYFGTLTLIGLIALGVYVVIVGRKAHG